LSVGGTYAQQHRPLGDGSCWISDARSQVAGFDEALAWLAVTAARAEPSSPLPPVVDATSPPTDRTQEITGRRTSGVNKPYSYELVVNGAVRERNQRKRELAAVVDLGDFRVSFHRRRLFRPPNY
jgi:hypothetical protein